MRVPDMVCALVVALYATPALSLTRFDIPAQRLDTALIALAEQGRLSIGGVDPAMSRARGHEVHGAMTAARALATVLRGSGFDYLMLDASTVRIVRAAVRPPPDPQPTVRRPPPPPSDPPVEEVIVTASKRQQGLSQYPGTVHIVRIGAAGLAEGAGSSGLVSRLPTLASTNLGPGRNKLFLRGIADSSFSGPTQSTIGLYLGDLRLTYNAPEPDLRLHDIDSVEVVEGPQGTLYGAGALGGIVRIIPNAPDASAAHAAVSLGASLTEGGAPGRDLAAMVNLPVIPDRLALRAIGYRQREGGATDNAQTGQRDTDTVDILGWRGDLQLDAGRGWRLNLASVAQFLETRDAHYAERGLPPRTRRAAIAQPHENDFRAASFSVRKAWDSLAMVSVTGAVLHDLSSVFDASGYQAQPGVRVYREDDRIRLITHETRLAGSGPEGATWVLGVSLLDSNERTRRSFDSAGAPAPITTLRNLKAEYALFGEATQPLAPRWSVTLGGRLTYARTSGELPGGAAAGFEPDRRETRLLPTAALSWTPDPALIVFLRYQSGFRSGGIAIDGLQIGSAQRFDSDRIGAVELGLRTDGARRVTGGLSLSHATWSDMQADLIGSSGLPSTSNIGRARINGLEGDAALRVNAALTLDGAVFLNDSAVRIPGTVAARPPDVPKLGARLGVAWDHSLSETARLRLGANARYVGASRLGATPPLDLPQGETTQIDLQAGLEAGTWGLTLEVTNLAGVSGNSFAYGNPFSVGAGRQITPLRPRTIRFGLEARF